VVSDIKYHNVREEPIPFMYLAHAQSYQPRMTLHARFSGSSGRALAAIRRELAALDADVPPAISAPLTSLTGLALMPQRVAALMIGVFGIIGLVLAAVGMYGVLAYTVSQRTREIGIRIALGAHAASVLRMILQQGVRLALIGVGVGTVVAALTAQLVRGFIAGVSPLDPATFVLVPALLLIVVLTASYVPARRAARVDPMTALRAE
jgi:ABC-type antimicrobial peptide transport system permease subunit